LAPATSTEAAAEAEAATPAESFIMQPYNQINKRTIKMHNKLMRGDGDGDDDDDDNDCNADDEWRSWGHTA